MNTDTITLQILDSGAVEVQPLDIVPVPAVDSIPAGSQAYAGEHSSHAAMDRYDGTTLPYSLAQSDGIFLFFFLSFLIFAHILKNNLAYLKDSAMVALSLRQSHDDSFETTSREVWFSAFMLLQTTLLISFGLYDTFTEYIPTQNSLSTLPVIASFVILMAAFFALKMGFYKMLGYVFDVKHLGGNLIQMNMNIFKTLGLLYYIPVLILIYLEYWHIYILLLMLLLFVVSLILYFIRIIGYFVREKFSFLFLIAYLCSVEIIPYLFVGYGLVYLYKTDLFSAIL